MPGPAAVTTRPAVTGPGGGCPYAAAPGLAVHGRAGGTAADVPDRHTGGRHAPVEPHVELALPQVEHLLLPGPLDVVEHDRSRAGSVS